MILDSLNIPNLRSEKRLQVLKLSMQRGGKRAREIPCPTDPDKTWQGTCHCYGGEYEKFADRKQEKSAKTQWTL